MIHNKKTKTSLVFFFIGEVSAFQQICKVLKKDL